MRVPPQRTKRRWTTISLRTLLAALTLVLLVGGWVADRRHRRVRAVRTLTESGARVNTTFEFEHWKWMQTLRARGPTRSTPPRRTLQEKVFGEELAVIDAPNMQLTAEVLGAIATFPRLRVLNLENTDLSDADLAALKELTQIESLDLSDTRITDDSADFFASRQHLEELDLSGAEIGDKTLDRLESHPTLTNFSFDRTRVAKQIR